MNKRLILGAAVAALFASASAQAQKKIDFVLNWVPGGDHAPYYYAKKLGWYAKEGIDLNLEPGKGSALATQRVGAGATPIGLADMGGVLVAKGKGADTVAVFNVYANSPQGMYWLKSSGITGVKDFRRQEDRQPRRRRRARDVAGAGQGQQDRPQVGDLGQHRRQCQARFAEGQVDRRHDVVLQHPPHLPARTRRRHGLPRLARRRAQPLRQFDHRQRQVPGREQAAGRQVREGHAARVCRLREGAQPLRAGADRRQRRAQVRQRTHQLEPGREADERQVFARGRARHPRRCAHGRRLRAGARVHRASTSPSTSRPPTRTSSSTVRSR